MNSNLQLILPDENVLNSCIHCGLCLAVCPTYEITKNERSSPRGRIRLIKSAADGEIGITKIFAEEMDFCLDCQACMTACPAGVQYGIMVESARVETSGAGYSSWLKKFLLKYVVPNKKILIAGARFIGGYNKSGLRKFVHWSGLYKVISENIPELEKLSPEITGVTGTDLIRKSFGKGEFIKKGIPTNSASNGESLSAGKVYRTAFHTGCIMDVMFPEVNKDTVELLARTNCNVYIPEKQTCCGSLMAHNGDFETARKLARKNIDAFEQGSYDILISNSAGCGAFMKEYKLFLKDDPEYKERAEIFSSKVKDISEFYALREDVDYKETDSEITYHDACHLVHSQKVFNEPRIVFSRIPGLKVIELNESTTCCGSAGIYNITRYNDSMKILERKMGNIKNTNSPTVVLGNPGCQAQINYGSEKFSVKTEAVHISTFLLKSLK